MKKVQDLQDQLSDIAKKVQRLTELMSSLRTENIALRAENEQLKSEKLTQNQVAPETHLPAEQEGFLAQVMQAKKIKREVEQALRDAERKLEALRF